jgi:protease-4
MDCDTIIAHPSTLTGSIGVISIVPNINRLLKNISISVDTISTGPAANYPNFLLPMTDYEKQEFSKMTRSMYDKFVNLVANARKKSYNEIHSIAKGRIWVGADAYKLGLVDVLGGLQTAIDLAKKRMNVGLDVAVKTKIYPKPEEDIEALLSLFGLEKDNESRVQVPVNSTIKELSYIINSMGLIPNALRSHLAYFSNLLLIAEKEQVIVAMPSLIEIK